MIKEMEVFPTLVTVVSNFLDDKFRENLISYVKNNVSVDDHPSLSSESKSSFNTSYSVLLSYNNIDLIRKVELEINKVANRMGLSPQLLYNSWINFQKKDSKLRRHKHKNSFISGAIYLNVDDDSSKLYFYNPNPYIFMVEYESQNKYNYEHVWVQPKNGDLILFPSWLSHGSDEKINKTKERIVLSFNSRKVNE